MAEVIEILAQKTHFDVVRFGSGPRTLVLLPGLSLKRVAPSAEAVQAAYQPLCKEFTIHLIDAREEVPANFSIACLADDVAAVMEQLGLEHAAVLGVSMGGMIAQELTLRYPHLVESLVLAATASRIDAPAQKCVQHWIALAQAHDAVALNRAMREAIYTPAFLEQYASAFAAIEADATITEMDRVATLCKMILAHSAYERLTSISCPVYVIAGAQDQVFGCRPSLDMAARLGCDVHVFGAFGHSFYDECPAFKTQLLAFLA